MTADIERSAHFYQVFTDPEEIATALDQFAAAVTRALDAHRDAGPKAGGWVPAA